MIALYGTPIWKSIRNNFSQQHIWKHISNFSQQLPEHINSVTSGPRACSGNVSMCIWYVLGGHRPFPSVLWHVFGCFADFYWTMSHVTCHLPNLKNFSRQQYFTAGLVMEKFPNFGIIFNLGKAVDSAIFRDFCEFLGGWPIFLGYIFPNHWLSKIGSCKSIQ